MMTSHAHDRVFDASRAERLHSPQRQKLMPLGRLMEALSPLLGQTWIDVGAGTGYYALALAKAVGETGRVYAIDRQAAMLSLLKERIPQGLETRVVLHEAMAEQLPLDDAVAHGLLLGNCYHELDERPVFLREARRVLRPGGRLVVIDWLHRDDADGPLPSEGPPDDHRLPLAVIDNELSEAGFAVELRRDLFAANYIALGSLP